MLNLVVVSQAFLWVVIAVLCVVVFALARQIGVLHQRIAPMGALMTDHGPPVQAASPLIPATMLDGTPFTIGVPDADGRSQLLLFVSPDCIVCKRLIPVVKQFAGRERLATVFIGDDVPGRLTSMVAKLGLQAYPFINSALAGRTFHVDKLPYAVLLDAHGRISGKGLVNTREHLESLVGAQESGFATIQDMLTARTADHLESRHG